MGCGATANSKLSYYLTAQKGSDYYGIVISPMRFERIDMGGERKSIDRSYLPDGPFECVLELAE